jgi:hypothetical protein
MNSNRQVTVRGAPAAIEAWLQTLDGPFPEGWSRAPDIEQKARGKRKSRWPICLVWSGNGGHARTAVFLQPVSDTEVGIVSVVALDRRELATEELTAALNAFRMELVAPRGNELQLIDRPNSVELSELISPQAQARFMAFARTANKTVLRSGVDLPRWYDFLIQLHRDAATPPREALEAALKKEELSPEVIGQLLDAYEHSEDLLIRYDAFGERE